MIHKISCNKCDVKEFQLHNVRVQERPRLMFMQSIIKYKEYSGLRFVLRGKGKDNFGKNCYQLKVKPAVPQTGCLTPPWHIHHNAAPTIIFL